MYLGFTFFSVYRWARLVIYFSAARFGASDSIVAKSGRAVSRCVMPKSYTHMGDTEKRLARRWLKDGMLSSEA